MNNNIFVKLDKKKYNPDIESKLNNINNDRQNTKFNLSKTIYNPITGIIPTQLKCQNDLVLQKDKSYNNVDIKTLILQKETEREQQNKLYKPVKTKVSTNTIQTSSNTVQVTTNTDQVSTNLNRTDYIKSYNELKNGSQPKEEIKQNNYNNILDGLKDLGIIK